MQVKIKKEKVEEIADEALAIFVLEDQALKGKIKKIDTLLNGAISDLIKSGDFTGKLNQTAVLYPKDKLQVKRILLVGLGKKEKFDLDKLRQGAGTVCKKAKELKVKSISAILPEVKSRGLSIRDFSQAVVEGVLLSNYQMKEYKTTDKENIFELETLTISDELKANISQIEKGAGLAETFSWATNLARDMINHPSNIMTPTKMSEIALDLAKEYKFKCQVLSKEEIKKLGMGAFLGVTSGSDQPPKFITMEHGLPGKKMDTLVLVGKGITFDSGGISIKPSEKMEEMKGDMSGGAAVIAIIAASTKMKLPLHLIGLVPACENLPSGTALKPGDILKSYSGKTIEVISTDAEGRLILADALSYAGKYNPDAIIDIATLTGACVVALGHLGCGMLGNNEGLKSKIRKASLSTGEKVWELPLWEEYDEQIKSDLADVKNVGGRPAGTITAAAFLKKFVENYPWVHLDIAGMDWEEKGKPYIPKGGIGFGVRLVLQFLRNWAKV
jgi:leucyl aminopeptidase